MTTKNEIFEKIGTRTYKDSNGCWIWMGTLNQNGRPKIHFDERRNGGKMITILPHIFLYELEHEEVDARYFDNVCGNSRCINPEHHAPRTLETRMKNYIVSESGCWEWQGNVFTETGYGSITIDGKSQATHRVSYQLHIGEIPRGLMVLHKCNNRICVNPDHLYVGTHNNNMKDMANANSVKGEKNGNSVLTKNDVIEIKKLIKSRMITYQQIADKFEIGRQTVKDIASGRTWAWVIID